MHGGDYGMFFGGGLMWLFWIIVFFLFIALVKVILGASEKDNTGNKALDILKQRYARGEIDKEEYEERKRELEKT